MRCARSEGVMLEEPLSATGGLVEIKAVWVRGRVNPKTLVPTVRATASVPMKSHSGTPEG